MYEKSHPQLTAATFAATGGQVCGSSNTLCTSFLMRLITFH